MLLRFGDEETLQPAGFYESRCGSRNPGSPLSHESIGPWGLKRCGIGRGQGQIHVRQVGSGFCASFSFAGRRASLRCRFGFGPVPNNPGPCVGCILCSGIGHRLFARKRLVADDEAREKPRKIGTPLALARLENKPYTVSTLSGLTSNRLRPFPTQIIPVIRQPATQPKLIRLIRADR